MKSIHDYRGEQRAARRRYRRAFNKAARSFADADFNKLMKLADAHYKACARTFDAYRVASVKFQHARRHLQK